MDKYERLEEFKRTVLKRLYYDEEIPPEIEEIITQAFNGLLNEYDSLRCDTSSIGEYIEGNFRYARNEINRYLNENRKTSQIQYVQSFMSILEQEVNNNENQTTNLSKHQQIIEQMDSKDGLATDNVKGILTDLLKDVQSRQNRILDARGYSDGRIYEIQQETQIFIDRFMSMNEEKIYEVLKRDSTSLKAWLLEEYQNYVRQEQIAQNKEAEKTEKGKNEREEFVESLDAGISLEEQSQDAKERNERQTEENKEKEPNLSDLIEHLFD